MRSKVRYIATIIVINKCTGSHPGRQPEMHATVVSKRWSILGTALGEVEQMEGSIDHSTTTMEETVKLEKSRVESSRGRGSQAHSYYCRWTVV